MKIRLFYHSLLSDWNHGNAHFLRGVASELIERGHDVLVFEERGNWSVSNLRAEAGEVPIQEFRRRYPTLKSVEYDLDTLEAKNALGDADLVIVHEWNRPELVQQIGEARASSNFVLLFHDTHHRLVTAAEEMKKYDLSQYDAVLAYGEVLSRRYRESDLAKRVYTWHEAADHRVFSPRRMASKEGDLVWIGNWGDEERTEELHEFLIKPVKKLGLSARVYGVRYPEEARRALADAGIEYAGWLPNFRAPEIFARFRLTVHVPRRPYVEVLRGIPTIRPFEALACGIPMISSPWHDEENLFSPGRDFLVARNGEQMTELLRELLADEKERERIAQHGLSTIRQRHTCAHRVEELLDIYHQLKPAAESREASAELAV
jgi:spore maturation protein CgeB